MREFEISSINFCIESSLPYIRESLYHNFIVEISKFQLFFMQIETNYSYSRELSLLYGRASLIIFGRDLKLSRKIMGESFNFRQVPETALSSLVRVEKTS